MRFALSVFRGLLWTVLIVVGLIQILVLYALTSQKSYPVTPLVCTIVLMLVGIVLFFRMKTRRYIGLTVCAAAAIAFILIAIDLYRAFPSYIQVSGTSGLDLWKTIWRHCSPALIPLLMLPIWVMENRLDVFAEIRKAKQKATEPFHPILEENANLRAEDVLNKNKKPQKGIRIRK